MSKIIEGRLVFASIYFRHPFNQSFAKLKQIAICEGVNLFLLWAPRSFHPLIVSYLLIGRCDYFGFAFTTLIEKAPQRIVFL